MDKDRDYWELINICTNIADGLASLSKVVQLENKLGRVQNNITKKFISGETGSREAMLELEKAKKYKSEQLIKHLKILHVFFSSGMYLIEELIKKESN